MLISHSSPPEIKKIQLSICILTYNQPSDILRLFGSLIPQCTDEVEIVIRDDSTSSDTEIIVDLHHNLANIRYFRGVKEGIDKTIIFLTKEAQGRYVWWIGDDDLRSDAIGWVLNVINNYPGIGFIWANYSLMATHTKAVNLGASRLFSSRSEILLNAGAALGFISSTIVRGDLAKGALQEAIKHVGTAFVNLYIVLDVITKSEHQYYIDDPIVIADPASSEEIKGVTLKSNGIVENKAFEVFGINFRTIVLSFKSNFPAPAVELMLKRSFTQMWRGVIVGWIGGWDSPNGKRIKLMRHFYRYPEAWVAFLLFSMPLWVVKVIYQIYKKFK